MPRYTAEVNNRFQFAVFVGNHMSGGLVHSMRMLHHHGWDLNTFAEEYNTELMLVKAQAKAKWAAHMQAAKGRNAVALIQSLMETKVEDTMELVGSGYATGLLPTTDKEKLIQELCIPGVTVVAE